MTVEEALAASVVEPVNDIFEINPETRVITVPASEKLFGVANDGNTERKHFRCPKVVGNNIDLSTMHLYINYQNANGDKYPYLVEDVQTDGDYITFSWLIGPDVVAYKGQVKFIVCAKKGDGTISEWNTTLAEGTVLEGLEAEDEVVERNPDIITQLLNRMREAEKIATKEAMQEYVNTYLTEHPVEIDETLTNPYKNKTIVAFGDSILAGWGWKEGTGIIQPLKEKYTDTVWINKAESGANMAVTSNPSHTPIVTQIKNYTGAADAIIFDGGVNDINSSIPVGSIESGYDASYNTRTFCGALESALQHIMDRYPLAVKLYIIPHSFAKDNSYVDSIYSKAIEICDKWNMPFWANDWIIEQTNASCKVGDTIVATDAIDSFKLSSPYYLGNMSKNSTPAGTGVVGKIYYAQIYSGDTLVADMIPVKKSDGTLCLYDKVRKKYIYNAGTGTLKEG